MDEFLTAVYPHYDLVVWSQTHWKYIDIKVTQLGMMSNPNFKLCFILDKTYMFNVSTDKAVSNKVKPLQLIWAKYPNLWGSSNTVHVDDIEKNFCLNPSAGILISPFHRAPLPAALQAASAVTAAQQSQLYDSHIYNSHRPVYNTCSVIAANPATSSSSSHSSTSSTSTSTTTSSGPCGIGCGGTLWKHSSGLADLEESTPASTSPLPANGVPDCELVTLARYLVKLAEHDDVSSFDHSHWSSTGLLTVMNNPQTLN